MSPSITTPMSTKTVMEEAASAGSVAGLGGCAFSSAEQILPAHAFVGTLMSREAYRRSHGAGGVPGVKAPGGLSKVWLF
jgi:hypothetical protein